MKIEKQVEILNEICPLEKGYKTSKRALRLNFFENIQTEIQAYLLGFYVADGSVDEKRHSMRVSSAVYDSEVIKLFQDFISPNARVVLLNRKNVALFDKIYNNCKLLEITITGKQIYENLNRFGFGPRKTYNALHLPHLEDDLIWSFIRGYFDGDGWVTACLRKPNLKNRERNYRVCTTVGIVAKTDTLLQEISEFLKKYDITSTICHIIKTDCYRLQISSNKSIRLLFNYFYKDSNFYLKRKYEKFNHFVNTEVTQLIDEYRNAQKTNASESNNSSTSAEHPTGVNMCAELTGNGENSEIKSSEDNKIEDSQKF